MSTPGNIDISNIPAINHKYFAYFSKIAPSQATSGERVDVQLQTFQGLGLDSTLFEVVKHFSL
jgi:hypothetical protein